MRAVLLQRQSTRLTGGQERQGVVDTTQLMRWHWRNAAGTKNAFCLLSEELYAEFRVVP